MQTHHQSLVGSLLPTICTLPMRPAVALVFVAAVAVASGSPLLRAVRAKLNNATPPLGWSAPGHEIVAAIATTVRNRGRWVFWGCAFPVMGAHCLAQRWSRELLCAVTGPHAVYCMSCLWLSWWSAWAAALRDVCGGECQ